MKKLTLFAVVALSSSLALAGCKKKRNEEGKDTAPVEKTGEMKPDDKAAAPKPDDKAAAVAPKPDDKAAPAAAGDLPKEGADYKAAIDKLATCDKPPQQARDAMKKSYDAASATWVGIPPEAKATLAKTCQAGADAVQQSGKASCGW